MKSSVGVITVDGPSGSGKGTISRLLARRLGWRWLDSGAIYRVLALAAKRNDVSLDDDAALAALARRIHIEFSAAGEEGHVRLDGDDVTQAIRTEECGVGASRVAAHPLVRASLLELQRSFRRPPGLVADGRDMGTVVFPDVTLKIYLTASLRARAERRWKQLREHGVDANIQNLYETLAERDRRDQTRSASPLRPAPDAVVIDSTDLDVGQVMARILAVVGERGISKA